MTRYQQDNRTTPCYYYTHPHQSNPQRPHNEHYTSRWSSQVHTSYSSHQLCVVNNHTGPWWRCTLHRDHIVSRRIIHWRLIRCWWVRNKWWMMITSNLDRCCNTVVDIHRNIGHHIALYIHIYCSLLYNYHLVNNRTVF